MAGNSRTRGARYGIAVVLCLVVISAVGGPIITATTVPQGRNDSTGQNQTHGANQGQRHTLVITHVSGSPSWVLTASGSIQLDTTTTEDTDSIGGMTASGSVGGLPWEENVSDPKDVIYFTGEILQFNLDGTEDVRVTLDGKRVNPQSLKNTPTPTPTANTPITRRTTETETATQTPALSTPMTPPSTAASPQSSRPTGSATAAGDSTGLGWLPSNVIIVLVVIGVLGALLSQRD